MNKYEDDNEILAAYALGALSEVEARELLAQAADNAKLTAAIAEWQNAAANLAFDAPAAEPSADVRANIMAAIRRTPQNSNQNPPFNKVIGSEITQTPSEKSNVVRFPVRSPKTFLETFTRFGAIAASIIAVLLGIALYSAVLDNQQTSAQLAEATQKLSAAEQKIREAQTLAENERQERDLLASPANFVRALGGTQEVPTARARLVFDPKTGRAFLSVENLPHAPAGKAYQIWWITDPKKPAPGKTFETDAAGNGILRDQIPATSLNAGVFAVTLEPSVGSPSPTTSPVLISAT